MAQCMFPFSVKDKLTNATIGVPCGKCPHCYRRRVSAWSFRLMKEDRFALSSYFITLTYDTKHVPITDNGYMTLSKRDCQLFMKRLRKLNNNKLKYYLVGEYGGKTNRPHYHLILFNATINSIQVAWNLGNVHYGHVSGASVGYTLKYMSKVAKIPMHKNDDRVPEFALMSKGLGSGYLTESMIGWHKADITNRMYVVLEGGQKVSMPRYYKDKIYNDYERKLAANATLKRMDDKVIESWSDKDYEKNCRNKVESDKQLINKTIADRHRNSKI